MNKNLDVETSTQNLYGCTYGKGTLENGNEKKKSIRQYLWEASKAAKEVSTLNVMLE